MGLECENYHILFLLPPGQGAKFGKYAAKDTLRRYMAEITRRISSPHMPYFAARLGCTQLAEITLPKLTKNMRKIGKF